MPKKTKTTKKTDNNEIEKKKKENSKSSDGKMDMNSLTEYFKYIVKNVITISVVLVLGTALVYSGKVSQANILPTNTEFFPYTDEMPKYETSEHNPVIGDAIGPVSIDIVKNKDGSELSTKIAFPTEENKKIEKNGVFGFLKNIKEFKNSNVFYLYFATLIQQTLANNLHFITVFSNFFNENFSETVNTFILPFFFIFFFIFTIAFNYGYLLWASLFKNLGLFLCRKEIITVNVTENNKTTQEEKTQWYRFDMFKSPNFFKSFFITGIGFFLILSFGLGIVFPILSFIIAIYSFLFPLFLKANVTTTDGMKPIKPYTFTSALQNTVKYKILIIMILITYFIIFGAKEYFGTYVMGLTILATAFLYFFTTVYRAYIPGNKDNATPVDLKTKEHSYKQFLKKPLSSIKAAVTSGSASGIKMFGKKSI